MPTVKVNHKTSTSPDEAFKSLKGLFSNDAQLKKLDPDFKLSLAEDSKTGQIISKLFKAEIKILPNGSGSEVAIVVDLPFHLALIKGLVEQNLKQKLGDFFKA
jgi:hypothetical protein